MKEFALKHPIITFLLADTVICGVLNVLSAAFGKNKKEETVDEPACDHQ